VHHAPTNSPDSGFALLIVLWALLLLSILAGGYLLEARAARTVAATAVSQARARALADAAINRSIMALLNPRDPLRLPLDGSLHEIRLLDHRIALRWESEAGKVDLNAAPAGLLTSVLQGQGLSEEEAAGLAKQIVVWRSPSRGPAREAATALYREAGRSYGPRFGPFRSIGELRLVVGVNDALQTLITPLITVWSNTGAIDRSVANENLLHALETANDSLAGRQMAARQAGRAAGSDRPPALGEVLTITARLEMADMVFTRTAAVQIAGDRTEPYRVLSWH
jgi:general secretion pathway protein K